MKNIIRRLMTFLLIFALCGGILPISVNALDAEAEETTAEVNHSFYLPSSLFENRSEINAVGESVTDADFIFPKNSLQYVQPGDSVTLCVDSQTVEDLSQVNFQWFEAFYEPDTDSFNLDQIEGADSSSYEVNDIQQARYFMCRGTWNEKTLDLYFTIYLNSGFYAESADGNNSYTIDALSSVTLSVSTGGDENAEVAYIWYRVLDTDPETGIEERTLIEGDYGPSYTVYDEAGTFDCKAVDLHSGLYSEIRFQVNVNNYFSIEASEPYVTVEYNQPVTLSVSSSGINLSGITYRWYKGVNTVIEGAVTSELTIDAAVDSGEYHCRATDQYGSESVADFYLSIDNKLSAYAVDDQTDFEVDPHDSVELSVGVDALDLSGIVYQWFDGNTNQLLAEGSDTYILEDVTASKQIYCYVIDRFNNMSAVWFYVRIANNLKAEADGGSDKYVKLHDGVELKVNVSADDMDDIKYTWSGQKGEIEGADTDTYLVQDVTDRQYYTCMVEDRYGSHIWVDFNVYVDNSLEVECDGSPNVFVSPHGNAELKVRVTADDMSGVTYKWYDSDYEIIEGADSDTLLVEDVTELTQYSCEVSDGYGNSRWVYFSVFLENHFKVTAENTDIIVAYNDPAEFSVTVTADDMSDIRYEWYYGTYDPEYGYGFERIPEAEGNSYSVEHITERCRYEVWVYDKYGNSSSIGFYVSIDNGLRVNPSGNPYVTVDFGGSAELKVIAEAYDMSQLTYEWYVEKYDSEGNYQGLDLLPGETADTLAISGIRQKTNYYCRVSDQYGNDQAVWFYINIENHLKVYADGDTDLAVSPGDTVTLKVIVEADDLSGIRYEWASHQFDDYGYLHIPIEGAVTDTLTVENIHEHQGYTCKVYDRYGGVKSVSYDIVIENHLSAKAVGGYTKTIGPNESVELKVEATADDMTGLTYVWKNSNGNVIEGADSDTYTAANITTQTYIMCIVTDRYMNTKTIGFNIYIDNELRLERIGAYSLFVDYDGSAELKVSASAKDASQLTYTWECCVPSPYGTSWRVISDATGDTLNVDHITSAADYYCHVRDQYGNSDSVNFHVTIDNKLYAEPADGYTKSVQPHESVELKVIVSALDMEGIRYVWRSNGELVSGADTDTLLVEDVDHYMQYTCYVYDRFNNEANVWFSIYIDNHFEMKADGPTEFNVASGESAELKVIVTADDMEGITYQWYREEYEEEYDRYSIKQIPKATGPSYILENVTERTQIYCHSNDKYGSGSDVYFFIGVENHFKAEADSPTVIEVSPHGSAELKVKVTADNMEGIKYRWYGATEFNNNSPVLKIDDITRTQTYSCTVVDAYGNSQTVLFNVRIKNNLVVKADSETNILVPYGGSAELRVIATADDMEGLTYSWVKEGGRKADGAVDGVLKVENITYRDYYFCIVTDKYYNSYSITFSVGVENHLTAAIENGTEITVPYNSELTLKAIVQADDMTDISIYWVRQEYDEKHNIEREHALGGGTDTLNTGKLEKAGSFSISVGDRYGNYAAASIKVLLENDLTAEAVGQTALTVKKGSDVPLKVTAHCSDMEGVTYHWYIRRQDYGYENLMTIEGADQPEYTVENIENSDEYVCVVRDKYYNDVRISFRITVFDEAGAPVYTWLPTETGYDVKASVMDESGTVIEETVTAEFTVIEEPGCTTEGAGRYTAVFTNKQFETQVKDMVIGSLGHELVKTEARAATCEQTGNIEYWTCTRDGKHFTDGTGIKEITMEETVIPALGHKWDEGKVTKEPTCAEAGVRTHTCQNDPAHTKSEEIPALGHAYELKEWKWSADSRKAEAVFECKNDKTHTKTEEAKITVKEEGSTRTVTAEVIVDGKTYTDTKTEEIEPEQDLLEELADDITKAEDPTEAATFIGNPEEVKEKIAEALNEGKKLEVELESTPVEDISTTEEALIIQTVGETEGADYFDINLFLKTAGDEEALAQITETKEPLTITLPLSEEAKAAGKIRLIRVHEGKAEELKFTVSEDGNSITFTTDKFSTYAILYGKTEEIKPEPVINYIHKAEITSVSFKEPSVGEELVYPADLKVPEGKGYRTTPKPVDPSSGQGAGGAIPYTLGTIENPVTKITWDYVGKEGDSLYYTQSLYAEEGYEFAEDTEVYLNGKKADKVTVNKDQLTAYFQFGPLENKEPTKDEITRIFGNSRFETSMKIADAYKEEKGIDQFESVILTSGTNFADALAGSYLSYVKDAPILITSEKFGGVEYYKQVNEYIKKNLKAKGTVYVLGGEAAVPERTIEELKKDFNVERLAGGNRYETNIRILEEANVKDEDILVCTGGGFADSLSASAVKRPILLVGNELSAMQKEYLTKHTKNRYYVIGGTTAVNTVVENSLKTYGKVTRLAGGTRHETSVMIAEEFCNTAESAVLAYSYNFPDGLCGGPLAAAMNAPIILTRDINKDNAAEWCKTHKIQTGYVTGGTGLISDESVQFIFDTKAEIKVR